MARGKVAANANRQGWGGAKKQSNARAGTRHSQPPHLRPSFRRRPSATGSPAGAALRAALYLVLLLLLFPPAGRPERSPRLPMPPPLPPVSARSGRAIGSCRWRSSVRTRASSSWRLNGLTT